MEMDGDSMYDVRGTIYDVFSASSVLLIYTNKKVRRMIFGLFRTYRKCFKQKYHLNVPRLTSHR